MKKRKIISLAVTTCFLLLFGLTISKSVKVKTQVKELFKMNKKLQEEGYYMAEFEFKMLGFAYYLDKAQYIKALKMLSDYHTQLTEKTGLVKIPTFKTSQEEIDFFLNLQNPKTGAFMDENAPFCTYWSCTENVLLHLESLSDSSSRPFQLKYPLKFLDSLSTPENLQAYLNDISYVGFLAQKFPQTSFHFARDVLSIASTDNILELKNLYIFSLYWK